MRISSTLFFQTGLNSINAQQADLMHLFQQIGSGQRMVTPADDPLAAAQAINISQSQSLNKRFADNREVLKNSLGIEENGLNSATTLMQDIKTRLVELGNGTLSDADRMTLADVLQKAKDSMLAIANSTDGSGQYLFSGNKGNQAAFVADANGKVTYNGDTGTRSIQADQTRQMESSDVGSDIFASASAGSKVYVTSARVGNTGTALIGTPAITDSSGANVGNTFKIVFSDPLTYSVTVTDPRGNQLSPPYGNTYTAGTTNLALPGGVQVRFSGTPATGDIFTVEPVSAPQPSGYVTKADPLNIGTEQISKLTVTDPAAAAGKKFDITFSGPPVNQFSLSVTDAASVTTTSTVPYVPGSASLDLPGVGVQLKFSGEPADTDKFTVDPATSPPPSADLNIFNTFDDIIAALKTPTNGNDIAQARLGNALASAMQRMDVNYDKILTVRASVGARMNEIDALDATGNSRGLSFSSQLSKLEDVDYYAATTSLTLRQSALQAASLAFTKIQATSLFNMGSK